MPIKDLPPNSGQRPDDLSLQGIGDDELLKIFSEFIKFVDLS